jgi:hypothetical protein
MRPRSPDDRSSRLPGSFQNGFGQLFEQTVLPDDNLGLLVVAQQLINQLLSIAMGSPIFFLPFTQFYLHPLTSSECPTILGAFLQISRQQPIHRFPEVSADCQ